MAGLEAVACTTSEFVIQLVIPQPLSRSAACMCHVSSPGTRITGPPQVEMCKPVDVLVTFRPPFASLEIGSTAMRLQSARTAAHFSL